MPKKKVPLKNYIILGMTIIVTMLVIFYCRSWYVTARDYYNKHSLILDVVSEIRSDEIVNYAYDNPNFVLYVSSGNNKEIKSMEKEFKKFILKQDLENNVLYLNLEGLNIEEFNNEINKFTNNWDENSLNDINSAVIYVFVNRKIVKKMDIKTSPEKMKIIFQAYGIIYND